MTPEGGPAFPVCFEHDECTAESPGMSLRDWFAGMALQGMVQFAGSVVNKDVQDAYRYADAMLAERSKAK